MKTTPASIRVILESSHSPKKEADIIGVIHVAGIPEMSNKNSAENVSYLSTVLSNWRKVADEHLRQQTTHRPRTERDAQSARRARFVISSRQTGDVP
jgi:hypothetical protein